MALDDRRGTGKLAGRDGTYNQGHLNETAYAEASWVSDDKIVEQSESTYDAASNTIQSVSRQRYHNAPA